MSTCAYILLTLYIPKSVQLILCCINICIEFVTSTVQQIYIQTQIFLVSTVGIVGIFCWIYEISSEEIRWFVFFSNSYKFHILNIRHIFFKIYITFFNSYDDFKFNLLTTLRGEKNRIDHILLDYQFFNQTCSNLLSEVNMPYSHL